MVITCKQQMKIIIITININIVISN